MTSKIGPWKELEVSQEDWDKYQGDGVMQSIELEVDAIPSIPFGGGSFIDEYVQDLLDESDEKIPDDARGVTISFYQGDSFADYHDPSSITIYYYVDCTEADIKFRKWKDLVEQERLKEEELMQKRLDESNRKKKEEMVREYLKEHGLPPGFDLKELKEGSAHE
jgi:hypothetical protein